MASDSRERSLLDFCCIDTNHNQNALEALTIDALETRVESSAILGPLSMLALAYHYVRLYPPCRRASHETYLLWHNHDRLAGDMTADLD